MFHEFARDVPEYIDPLDGRRWMETIRDFASPQGKLREAQLRRLTHFRPPTWAEHFQRVDRLLHHVVRQAA